MQPDPDAPIPDDLRAADADVRGIALALPGAVEEHPWGHRAFKVKGKTFLYSALDPAFLSLSMKLPTSGAALLAEAWATPTGYGLGKAGWVTVRVPAGGAFSRDRVSGWLRESWLAMAPKRMARASGLAG